MKWNEPTWYSKWIAMLLFLVIIPILAFSIGVQYEDTVDVLNFVPETLPVITTQHSTSGTSTQQIDIRDRK